MTAEPVEFDVLYFIAESCPVLDAGENELRRLGHRELATALVTLQQDVGVAIQHSFNPDPPPSGTSAAAFYDNYEPVTAERLRLFRDTANCLPEGEIKAAYMQVINQLPIPSNVVAVAKSASPPHP